ncbi:hypothetical protein SmJEL517_g05342 [Synchytrium microbalum]|uniref:HTH La-type RNA-binding domain-containing protein n=1 Tax=Synchytrium microbalum TaxID=1806994 RepID=A0A507C1D9_9FUNG|nr:uncharacterized protein SmJEL517_g05342 [Synchytrium microbalum]TPX31323.1 hypothetical protein SmJEL517_g05342 [Synchytrium microbalum]
MTTDNNDHSIKQEEAEKTMVSIEELSDDEALIDALKADRQAKIDAEDAKKQAARLAKSDDMKAKILTQVEYYFSDANLPTDLWLLRSLHANNGWLKLELLSTFNNMKKLNTNVEVIADALRRSPQLLQVSEDGLYVRRRGYPPELNAGRIDGLSPIQKSIYVGGFPLDLNEPEETIKGHFQIHGGDVKAVKLRMDKDTGKFKGSAFVEFVFAHQARKARFEADPKHGNTPLTINMKEEYINRKYAEHLEDEEKKAKNAHWKIGDHQLAPPPKAIKLPDRLNGALLHFKATEMEAIPEGQSFMAIAKEYFGQPFEVKWVHKPENSDDGLILYHNPGDAQIAFEHFGATRAKPDGLLNGTTTFRLATPEEESVFWQAYENTMKATLEERIYNPNGDRNPGPSNPANLPTPHNNRNRDGDRKDRDSKRSDNRKDGSNNNSRGNGGSSSGRGPRGGASDRGGARDQKDRKGKGRDNGRARNERSNKSISTTDNKVDDTKPTNGDIVAATVKADDNTTTTVKTENINGANKRKSEDPDDVGDSKKVKSEESAANGHVNGAANGSTMTSITLPERKSSELKRKPDGDHDHGAGDLKKTKLETSA